MNFLGWLAILFIALKLLGFIAWSWWLILLPLYGIFVIMALAIFGIAVVTGMPMSSVKLKFTKK
jgi:hypothetical protein